MYKKTLTDDLPANVFYRLFFTSFPVINGISQKLYIKRFILNAFSDFYRRNKAGHCRVLF